ncbi:MAG: hypothetical protein Ct9H300mP8_07790 [Gammaproteobacteria bacterium]|nr:MAG: hypothetical protein Ct9H300mP8_07790 [Gammaproteobacteria bacterium]
MSMQMPSRREPQTTLPTFDSPNGLAVIVRPPLLGSRVISVSLDQKAKSQVGFIGLETLDPTPGAPWFFPLGGVAVIATTTYAAMQTAKQLDIAWSKPNHSATTPSFNEKLHNLVHRPPVVFSTTAMSIGYLKGTDNP